MLLPAFEAVISTLLLSHPLGSSTAGCGFQHLLSSAYLCGVSRQCVDLCPQKPALHLHEVIGSAPLCTCALGIPHSVAQPSSPDLVPFSLAAAWSPRSLVLSPQAPQGSSAPQAGGLLFLPTPEGRFSFSGFFSFPSPFSTDLIMSTRELPSRSHREALFLLPRGLPFLHASSCRGVPMPLSG